jgi:hypothetical protein
MTDYVQLWGELHRWALTADPAAAAGWLDHFANRLPCGQCRRQWRKDLADSPPPKPDSHHGVTVWRRGLFAWTVTRHNEINRRLGKSHFSMREARQRWITDLSTFFDAVWCINLDADADRWQTFSAQLAACRWPFGPVARFSAIHGDTVGVPDHYHQGGGAWGCLQSHRRVLEASLMAGHQRILVMEDDADLRPGLGAQAAAFLADLGDEPWDCLMLGGQHMAAPRPFKNRIVRAANIQRTHCMAFSRGFMRELYRYWSGPLDQHCDWSLGPFAARFKTFAPQRFIVGQRGGRSWITGGQKPPEWWNPPRPDAPVIWLRCPREVLETCRDLFHAGNRRNAGGVCIGLADVFDRAKHPTPRQRIAALKSWITMIQWEVESRRDGSVCTIWNPDAESDTVKTAAGSVLMEIEAATEEKAREQAKQLLTLPPAR